MTSATGADGQQARERTKVSAGAPRRTSPPARDRRAAKVASVSQSPRATARSSRRASGSAPGSKSSTARTATTSRRGPALPWLRRNPPVVGLEVDGNRVTAVAVSSGTATAVATAHERNLDEAIATVLKQMPPAACAYRAVLVSDGSRLTRLDVSPSMRDRSQFTHAATAALGHVSDGVAVAGWVFDSSRLDSGLLSAGVATSAPAEPVHSLYAMLPSTEPTEVVTSSMASTPLEGLSLALRYTTAELTLVSDGHPIASQVLPSGGLGPLEAALGRGNVTGPALLAAALAGTGTDDSAARMTDRYLRAVVADVVAAISNWERAGEQVPREVFVYGPGARAVALPHLLTDVNLTRTTNGAVTGALIQVDPSVRPAAVGAYLAAATAGEGAPVAAFVDPAAVRQAERLEARRRAKTRAKVAVASAAMVLTAGLGPYAYVAAHDAALTALTVDATDRAVEATGLDDADVLDLSTYQWAEHKLTESAVSAATVERVLAAASSVGLEVNVDANATSLLVTGDSASAEQVAALSEQIASTTGWSPTPLLRRTDAGIAFEITLTEPERR